MLIEEHLRQRVRRDGGSPLITHYDLGTGSRTELSATTFANWVAKASSYCVEELELDAGDAVALPVLDEHPGHWMSLVWVMALWSTGCHVAPAEDARVVVVGPEALEQPAEWPQTVLACSLHPLGLGFSQPLPAGWVDWAVDVRSQPDQYAGVPPTPDLPAWVEPGRQLDQAALAATAGDPGRRLVRPGEPWPTVRDALVAPLLGGGSAVVVEGEDEAALARVVADERVVVPG
ncbi:TIGR03089 family protein [Auraticoccus sp. F435]|uniref:TIGR03089 family protein n=1 Tax=Auraticoccus cholistanensis TaxID=2656650 RepID=A0A6A9UUT9_9ACTN|nr:TIGR03089 family protein [Auraticoccus cholistanensis]MVA76706.1 TIGR03089 family protein [Auraticoccus cholistanensis]